jgi:hypothetical protein
MKADSVLALLGVLLLTGGAVSTLLTLLGV